MGEMPTNEEILASLEENKESGEVETGSKEAASQGEQVEDTPKVQENPGFQFKSLDELMGHKLKYSASGKEVEEPLKDILNRASQGYHYSQRMAELKSQEREWQRQLEEQKALADKYREIDDYARSNPQWFEYWNNAYQNRSLGVGGEQEGFDVSKIASLIDQKLAPFQETIQQQRERMEREKIAQEDEMLNSQVQSTMKEFSDVDFSATDPQTGSTLEHRVYQFMIDNGINDFNKAYKLMDYNNIITRQTEKAKADLVKQEQMKRKQGIVSETSVKSKPQPQRQNFRGLNPEEFERMQLDYLEQLRSGRV